MLRIASHLCYLGGSLLFVASGSSAIADAPAGQRVAKLVDGLLARSEAIISGRMVYSFSTSNAPERTDSAALVFSGSSWRIDDRVFGITRVNHHGSFLEAHRVAQPSGSIRNSATFETEKSIEYRFPHPPYFAGSFWYRGKDGTANYLRAHRKDAIHAGGADVSGVACDVIDWHVSADDRYKAFRAITSSLNKGGTLRVYVAESLGYALPRIDYLTAKGDLAVRFDAVEFRAVGGIFIPAKIREQTSPENGQKGFEIVYTIKSIDNVNKPIPDEEFEVALPPGTLVNDARGQAPVSFTVGDLP